MTYGLHVIRFPSGRYGFVGSIPTSLGYEIAATRSDVMGQRAHRNANGEIVTWKFPVFDTETAAIEYARTRGFEPKTPITKQE